MLQKIRDWYDRHRAARIITTAAKGVASLHAAGIAADIFFHQSPIAYEAQAQEMGHEEEKSRVELGYNALENAITNNGDGRSRLLTNIDIIIDGIRLGYNGLNEVTNGDRNTHFGRQEFYLGKKDSGTQGTAVIKTTADGILDVKGGIRNTSLLEKVGLYGFIDATVDSDAANNTIFLGIPIGEKTSFEVWQEIEFPFRDRAYNYNEFQVNRNITPRLALFGRVETINFEDPTYMIGFTIKK